MKRLIEAGKWVGALGVIGCIVFMLKNNYEGRKEIKRLEKKCEFWEDAFNKANKKACALYIEKFDVRYILRKIKGEELSSLMIKNGLTFSQAKVVYDYLLDD